MIFACDAEICFLVEGVNLSNKGDWIEMPIVEVRQKMNILPKT